MANKGLRNITENIKTSGFLSLMADETTDIANSEQLVIWLRWVKKYLETYKEVIRLHPLSSTNDAEIMFLILKNVLLRLGVRLYGGKGQCYVGAARSQKRCCKKI